jgi:hypothetical protein
LHIGGYIHGRARRAHDIAVHTSKGGIALGLPINPHADVIADPGVSHHIASPIPVVGDDDCGEDTALPPQVDPLFVRHGTR